MPLAFLERRRARHAQRRQREQTAQQVRDVFGAVAPDAHILEIGGGYNPRYLKSDHPHVFHLDHCSQQELKAKYAAMPSVAHAVDRIQPVDFIFDGRPIDQLVPPSLRFDVIFGSHVLEHQVDLVGHLQSVERLLAPGGRVIHAVPDLRCCFDALRFPSVTADVLVAHHRAAPIHQGKQVFDTLSREISANVGHPLGDHELEQARFQQDLRHAYDEMRAAETPGHPYFDLHAWTFTPESFRLLMIELRMLGLTGLRPVGVTPTYANEFLAVLEPAAVPSADERETLGRERFELARSLRFKLER